MLMWCSAGEAGALVNGRPVHRDIQIEEEREDAEDSSHAEFRG